MEENIVEIKYDQTGASSNTNELGMREMQAKAYEVRNSQYLLIKAPPASGKSRALMFIALDKLVNQGIQKVIVAVPEKTIGRSFNNTPLKKYGFFEDWTVAPYFNLCDTENENNKTDRFREFFLQKSCNKLICTHSTLRNAFKEVPTSSFNDCLIAIDEFHHVAAGADNEIGNVVRDLLADTSAHILAMTGTYFRGDRVPVLRPQDEAVFYPVTYDYYQQLNGYKYLKTLGIGYKFYQGEYLSAIKDVLDITKKTIVHIPSVNSRASTGRGKYDEVSAIMSAFGEIGEKNYNTGIIPVTTPEGRVLKFADLVEDSLDERRRLQGFLQRMKNKDDIDIIIALGTAKEGFDWEWCEHCLTVGVRGSLTEIVQIIGRCTRDCIGKSHAQFTNLIAAPDAQTEEVSRTVNDMLKAITASLLMEQVMAPSWKFKSKEDYKEGEKLGEREIVVEGLKPLSSIKTKMIVDEQLDDLKATILQDDMVVRALDGNTAPEVINQIYIPKIIQNKYPDLNEEEQEEIRQRVILDTIVKGGELEIDSAGNSFLKLPNRFINLDKLNITLIDSINPFQRAYEVLSKNVSAPILKIIQDTLAEQRYKMTLQEAIVLFDGPFKKYMLENDGKLPSVNDSSPFVQKLAQAFAMLRNEKRRIISGLKPSEL